jgi:hypothetical protein
MPKGWVPNEVSQVQRKHSNVCAQVTWRIGQDTAVRGQFVTNRTLDNTKDTNFRAINADW